MDEELKRRIAASLDRPADAQADPLVTAALECDPQARAFMRGLYVIEEALRSWPTPARSASEWERFANEIERHLGEAPWEYTTADGGVQPLPWDPLERPPLRDADNEEHQSEQVSMAQSHDDKENDDDLQELAALVRSSSAPARASIPPPAAVRPGPSLSDDAMDDSSGIVDIQHLAEIAKKQSLPPPAATPSSPSPEASSDVAAAAQPTEAAVPPATAAESTTAPAVAEAKPVTAPAQPVRSDGETSAASPRPNQPRSKPAVAIWLISVAALAGIGFFMMQGRQLGQQAPGATSMPMSDRVGVRTATAVPPASAQAGVPSVATPPASAQANAPAPSLAPTPPVQSAPSAPVPQQQSTRSEREPSAAAQAESSQGSVSTGSGVTPVRAADQVSGAAERTTAAAGLARSAGGATGEGATESGNRSRSGAGAAGSSGADTRVAAATSSAETRASAGAESPTTTTTAAVAGPGAAGRSSTASPTAAPAAASGAPARPRSIDELMAAAVGGNREAAPATQQAESEDLPERPSRSQITATMAPLAPAVRACAQGQTGTATVALVINGDGSVANASVTGPFNPTVNNCIVGVVRRARFPRFRRLSIPLVYPFSIQPPQQ